MRLELLTPEEMEAADNRAIAEGPLDGYALMLRAGAAIADAAITRFPAVERIDVLCGPGNNGGDGYVAARILSERGLIVAVWAEYPPRKGSEAERAAADCPLETQPLAEFPGAANGLVIDALYGAGLSRALDGEAEAACLRVGALGSRTLSVDMPSGISGETGLPLGTCFAADLTVTFVRKKPGHVLQPGRWLCGELSVADIGVTDAVIDAIGASAFENDPAIWRSEWPLLRVDAHKYSRGHVGVFSGGPSATGAARLSAMAAARIGAGAVTLLSQPQALLVNAAHLTSIILRKVDGLEDVLAYLAERRPGALVIGPGFGVERKSGEFILALLEALQDSEIAIVFDADAISLFATRREEFFATLNAAKRVAAFLTPHEGEFARLFPEIDADRQASKLEKARAAAKLSGCTIIYKGPDTVVAAPDGRAVINTNGTPLLATAGSGDVLAGFIAGLAGQGMPPLEAAAAAVWVHAGAAREFGPGLIAEDLPSAVVPVLQFLQGPSGDGA